jgi:hypothetical protein
MICIVNSQMTPAFTVFEFIKNNKIRIYFMLKITKTKNIIKSEIIHFMIFLFY